MIYIYKVCKSVPKEEVPKKPKNDKNLGMQKGIQWKFQGKSKFKREYMNRLM